MDIMEPNNKSFNISNEDIEKAVLSHIEEIKKTKKEEEKIINDGAMDSIFNNLINIDNSEDKFFWDDEFLYYNKKDKEQKRLLGKQIYIIGSRVLNYFNKYKISFYTKTDNYFLTGFAIFKYNNNILYVEEMSGQGTCTGIGILNEFAKQKYGIKDIDESSIVDIEDILNDKPFIVKNHIYQNMLDKEIDDQLTELILDYGLEKIKERFDILQDKGVNNEENN